jgi:hypothetical protein
MSFTSTTTSECVDQMFEPNHAKNPNLADSRCNSLYKLAGWSALVAALLFRRNLAEEVLLFRSLGIIRSGPRAFPVSAVDWFTLLHTHRLIGLTFLNLFDAVNYVLVGLIFLGLCLALRRLNRSLIALAMALTFVAIAVYLASNQAFPLLSLSAQYALATSDPQRSGLLAAAEALLAIHNSGANYGNGPYIPFLFIGVAGLLIAIVMLRSSAFGSFRAYVGILANVFGLTYYVTLVLNPRLSFIPLSAAAPFLLIWYLLVGRKLLQLGSRTPTPGGLQCLIQTTIPQ